MIFYHQSLNGIFRKGTYVLEYKNNQLVLNELNDKVQDRFVKNKGGEFLGPNKKVYVRLRREFYHLIFNTLGLILQEYEKDKDSLFIINVEDATMLSDNTYIPFMFKILKEKNVNFKLVNVRSNNLYKIEDFWQFPNYPKNIKQTNNFIEECSKYFSDILPNKKVYVSRKKVYFKDDLFLFADKDKSNFAFNDDIRLDNDKKMEDYFSSLGFEIVYPEDFDSMESQIHFFSEVKTIASVSGSGLVNCLFMPNGGKVIELSAPILTDGIEMVHSNFHSLTFPKQHKYISVSSMRLSDEYINQIESDRILKEFICE
jgi:hypothetical protein